jgi:drug/metabolite transporter (DMT)-like permease
MSTWRLAVLTIVAMTAFAGNSILCRLALRDGAIDPASFTSVRLVSGAVVLCLLARLRGLTLAGQGSWFSAVALFAYAAAFSFAYVSLAAGSGALLLFGAVQATMIGHGWLRGDRLRVAQMAGLAAAMAGLIYLVWPGVSAPSLLGSVLMASAGIAWGVYSIRGRAAVSPIAVTAGNFLRAAPIALALSLGFSGAVGMQPLGLVCALLSGAVTSGLGYAIWYTALPSLKGAAAPSVQLSVPLLTALIGVAVLGEPMTVRLAVASVAILGGIAMVIIKKN